MTIVIVNNVPPLKISATKLTADPVLLSVEVINGFQVLQLASTSAPFGGASVQTGTLLSLAPPSNPDVRFFMRGPFIGSINGLIEDLDRSFAFEQVAPTLFLFDSPHGRVDGLFNQSGFAGPLILDLTFQDAPNPAVICRAEGSTSIQIRYPGCETTPLAAAGPGASKASALTLPLLGLQMKVLPLEPSEGSSLRMPQTQPYAG